MINIKNDHIMDFTNPMAEELPDFSKLLLDLGRRDQDAYHRFIWEHRDLLIPEMRELFRQFLDHLEGNIDKEEIGDAKIEDLSSTFLDQVDRFGSEIGQLEFTIRMLHDVYSCEITSLNEHLIQIDVNYWTNYYKFWVELNDDHHYRTIATREVSTTRSRHPVCTIYGESDRIARMLQLEGISEFELDLEGKLDAKILLKDEKPFFPAKYYPHTLFTGE